MTEYKTYKEYLSHPSFKLSVAIARKRAAGRCEYIDPDNICHHYPDGKPCGKTGVNLTPHHIYYCKWGEFDPPENLLMVCRECHEKAHTCYICGEIVKGKEVTTYPSNDPFPCHHSCFYDLNYHDNPSYG